MSKRYNIWDKVSQVITPSGELFTAEQWMTRYPVARLNNIDVLCANGEINGAFFGTLGQLKTNCEHQGAVFDESLKGQSLLDAIENWMDQQEAKSQAAAEEAANTPTAEERIAAAMEYQNLVNM